MLKFVLFIIGCLFLIVFIHYSYFFSALLTLFIFWLINFGFIVQTNYLYLANVLCYCQYLSLFGFPFFFFMLFKYLFILFAASYFKLNFFLFYFYSNIYSFHFFIFISCIFSFFSCYFGKNKVFISPLYI